MNICEKIDKSLDILFNMLLLCLILSSCSSLFDFEAEENETSLLWIREESQFVSYVVEDGMVFWEYEFCFENETPYNLTISTLGISLLENQTSGWVSHQNLFICEGINGQRKVEIEAGQKIIYRVTFSGESLGGEPDVGNLFPQHVTFIVDSSDEGLKTGDEALSRVQRGGFVAPYSTGDGSLC